MRCACCRPTVRALEVRVLSAPQADALAMVQDGRADLALDRLVQIPSENFSNSLRRWGDVVWSAARRFVALLAQGREEAA